MKRLYFDTALLVPLLIHEPGTTVAEAFLQTKQSTSWQISIWAETELASALAMQCRRGVLSNAERDAAWLRFQLLRRSRLEVLDPIAADFERAASFCLMDGWRLRAGDALHLAICQRQASVLVSFDKVLCEAARHHHVAVEQLSSRG